MAWQEWYMTPNGDNTNSGSTNADLAIATSTNGDWGVAAPNRFTAASGTPFSAASVGNWCSIFPDGNTPSNYAATVTAVNGGGASLDFSSTACFGTPPTNSATARSCKLGGALRTPVGLGRFTGTAVSPFRLNIAAGTLASTSSVQAFALNGTTLCPVRIQGYKTVPGDQENNGAAVAGTDIPQITFTTGNLTISGAYSSLMNVAVTGAPTTYVLQFNSNHGRVVRCRATNTNANAAARAFYAGANDVWVFASTFTATSTATLTAYNINNPAGGFDGCIFQGGIAGLAANAANNIKVSRCLFLNLAGDGITFTTGYGVIDGCSFYNLGGHGINVSGTPINQIICSNNYFENVNQAGKYAIANTQGTVTSLITPLDNLYYNCTGTLYGLSDGCSMWDGGTLSAAGFTNGAGGDFSLVPAARGLAFPGVFEGVSAYRGYNSHGAVQPNPAGGGVGRQPKLRTAGN